ncbi:outer membrane beta-barrel protein [Rudanella lutea]|uniref:type IX secretion/gliding motility protein PorT/SprT n=1 Tax=Rudanella lutea TaxID=451374 RepID=UPI000378B2D0|nr:outer membrane beta-barrel protein [Rudanella lutea]
MNNEKSVRGRGLRVSTNSIVCALFIIHCSLFINSSAHAQGYGYQRKHLEFYDDKPIHYGFFFAMPVTRFNVKYSPAYVNNTTVERLYSPNKVSFRVGLLVNAYLTDRFDFRFTPAVSLYGRTVQYEFADKATTQDVRESTWMEFPFLFKYKSERRRNSRMYLIAGATAALETNVRKRQAQSAGRLNTKTADLTLDYGVGFEQFLEYTKISPELRFSHGVVNLFAPTNASIAANTAGIQRLTSHTVTLYLNFE